MPDFIRECVRRKVSHVVQFKYAEGAFDVAGMLTHAGIDVKTVNVLRKSSPEEVSRAALAEMRKIAAKRPLPGLFIFTDDYLKTGVHPPELDLGSVYKPGATF